MVPATTASATGHRRPLNNSTTCCMRLASGWHLLCAWCESGTAASVDALPARGRSRRKPPPRPGGSGADHLGVETSRWVQRICGNPGLSGCLLRAGTGIAQHHRLTPFSPNPRKSYPCSIGSFWRCPSAFCSMDSSRDLRLCLLLPPNARDLPGADPRSAHRRHAGHSIELAEYATVHHGVRSPQALDGAAPPRAGQRHRLGRSTLPQSFPECLEIDVAL